MVCVCKATALHDTLSSVFNVRAYGMRIQIEQDCYLKRRLTQSEKLEGVHVKLTILEVFIDLTSKGVPVSDSN